MHSLGENEVSRTLARNRLTWRSLGGFVLAAAAPLTVVGAGVTNGWAVTGLVDIPAAYVVTAVVLGLFAVGYTAMARRLPNAGAFYTLLARGLGRPAGVAAGFVAVVSYLAMQVGLVGGLGVIGADSLHQVFGVSVAWWVVAGVGWAVIGLFGIARIDLNGRVLAILLLVECALIVVFDLVELAHPYRGQVSVAAVSPTGLVTGGVTAGLVAAVIAVTGFVGFEDAPNYAEEARPGAPTRAVVVSLVVTAVLYAGSSWAMTVTAGPANVVAGSRKYFSEYMFVLVGGYVPHVMIDLGRLLIMTSLFAAALAFHNTVNRYVFSMSRDRALPYGLSRTWTRFQSPAPASALQTALTAVVLVAVLAAGVDPQTVLFFGGTVAAGLGVVVLLTGCCAAMIAWFARYRQAETRWQAFVAPALAGVGLAVITVVTMVHVDTLMGAAPGSTVTWLLPTGLGAVAALGVLVALTLRLVRPAAYRRIGQAGDERFVPGGAHAAVPSGAVVLDGDQR